MDVTLLNQDNEEIDMVALAKEAEKEERKINSNIRNLVGEGATESVVDGDGFGMSSHEADEKFDD